VCENDDGDDDGKGSSDAPKLAAVERAPLAAAAVKRAVPGGANDERSK
jgi:hypothetical protein